MDTTLFNPLENLFNFSYSVNKTLVNKPIQNGRSFFKIDRPTAFTLCYVNGGEMKQITSILKSLELRHSIDYLPAGYAKGQPKEAYHITVELGYNNATFEVYLKEFGYSYGKIEFEGEEFAISHSFGSNGDTMTNWATNWNIANNQLAFIQLVEKKLKK
jgi:hypothetical protein